MTELPRRGRPRSPNKKVPVTLRVDATVLETFKATGRGWQTRMNEALAQWAATNKTTQEQQ